MAKKVKSSVRMVDFIIGKFLEKSKMKKGYSLLLTELNGNEFKYLKYLLFFSLFLYCYHVSLFLKIDFKNFDYKRLNRTVSQYTFSRLFRRINCNQRDKFYRLDEFGFRYNIFVTISQNLTNLSIRLKVFCEIRIN